MRRSVPLALVFAAAVASVDAGDIRLTPTTTVRLAGVKEAAALLGAADEFTERMSPFDRQARLHTDRAVSPKEFLAFAAVSPREWQPDEERKVAEILRAIGPKAAELKLNLPRSVLVIKTSGQEEGGAAYTRASAVVLPTAMLRMPVDQLRQVVTHELFHVLSRNDLALREALYASIGFLPCPEIALPKEFAARKITNPDAPRNDHYLRVVAAGKPTAAVPILYASTEKYDAARGGEFFQYMLFRLLAIEKEQNAWRLATRDGRAATFAPDDVERFYEQVGRNTEYTIHPEEILADNFALIVNGKTEGVPSPEVIQRIERALRSRPAAR